MNRLKLAFYNPTLAFRWLTKRGVELTEIELNLIAQFMRSNGVIIEAGSSDGVDTIRLAREFKSHRILAVEPVFEQYRWTKARTSNFDNVEVCNYALSTKSGTEEIYVGRSGPGIEGMGSSSLLVPTQHKTEFPEIMFESRQQVQSLTVEDFCTQFQVKFVDLFWLDVQGLELAIIKHSKQFFETSVNMIHMEVSRKALYEGMPLYDEILDELHVLGFYPIKKRVGRVSGNCLFQNQRFKMY